MKKTVSDGILKAEIRWSEKCSTAWVHGSDPEANNNWRNNYAYIEKHGTESGQPLIRSLSVTVPDGGSGLSNILGG